ncbi:uncharacterized protein LOC126737163 isoform X2 [Anthonomus grandis grandis]|uniref:uncharacterized protein LOC126737163 isoform X2 n=1 Tax=Anthonomus grandis grandis TaxID=2921223 RepID=UPI002164FC3C|nr:uncharacterized protein LOC126737163 isoform X2 [Anthonomus grandis grandis]
METETIDLTDPFEKYLKQNNWTAEGLNERLSLLAGTGTNAGQCEQKNITLRDLLDSSAITDEERIHINAPNETIILSDDESEGDFQKQEQAIQIIDISDDESEDNTEMGNLIDDQELSDLSDPENEYGDIFEESHNEKQFTETNDEAGSKFEDSLHSNHPEDIVSLAQDMSSKANIATESLNSTSECIIQAGSTNNLEKSKENTLSANLLESLSPKPDINDSETTDDTSLKEEAKSDETSNNDETLISTNDTKHLEGTKNTLEEHTEQPLTKKMTECGTENNSDLKEDFLLLELDDGIKDCELYQECPSENAEAPEVDNETSMPNNEHSEIDAINKLNECEPENTEVAKDEVLQGSQEELDEEDSTLSKLTNDAKVQDIEQNAQDKENSTGMQELTQEEEGHTQIDPIKETECFKKIDLPNIEYVFIESDENEISLKDTTEDSIENESNTEDSISLKELESIVTNETSSTSNAEAKQNEQINIDDLDSSSKDSHTSKTNIVEGNISDHIHSNSLDLHQLPTEQPCIDDVLKQIDTFYSTASNSSVLEPQDSVNSITNVIEIEFIENESDKEDEESTNEIQEACEYSFNEDSPPEKLDLLTDSANESVEPYVSQPEDSPADALDECNKMQEINPETLLINTEKSTLKEDIIDNNSYTPEAEKSLNVVVESELPSDLFEPAGCIVQDFDNLQVPDVPLEDSSEVLNTLDNKSLNFSEQVSAPQLSEDEQRGETSLEAVSEIEKETPSFDEGSDNDNAQINVEDIREQLKLQLSNLRTKRKMNIFQTTSPLPEVDDTEIQNEVKNVFHRPTAETFLDSANLSVDKEAEIKKIDASQDLKVKQNSEIDKRLELISEKPQESPVTTGEQMRIVDESAKAETEDDTVPEAFQELRKIIRKKKLKEQRQDSLNTTSSIDDFIKSNANLFSVKKSVISAKTIVPLDIPNNFAETQTKQPEGQLNDANAIKSSRLAVKSDNPFVSNTLDEFLTDSKLNVSYKIPKCDAEEGLQKDYFTAPVVPYHNEVKEEESDKSKGEPKYKPKTLAEKRRILEKKRKLEERRLKKQKAREKLQKRSYVLFKDKKVFLRSKTLGKCIASIQSTAPAEVQIPPRPRKPSLLTELHKKETTPVKYRPGPLCKKYLLQNDYAQWRSELKPLPTVVLNIMPETGKPVHPNLLSIVNHWNGDITKDQVEFALSALERKPDENLNIFQFTLQYENRQDSLLVRKRIPDDKPGITLPQHCGSLNKDLCESSITEEVHKIIDGLLNYVEVKELAPALIKEDEVRDTICDSPSPIKFAGKGHHTKKKLSKTMNRELMRLSCKVVSMEVKESAEVENCLKPHCKFGCVCKSLCGETLLKNLHCRKVKCMFGCVCPKEKSKITTISEPSLSLSNDLELLSTDTVNRIEDEAKKYLAKEEKEFTQTIICANDKTIVVGIANKPRRAAKAPKKYTGFFEDDNVNKERIKKKQYILKPCDVLVENWDFSEIEPYCLIHNLYSCHCKGLATCRVENKANNKKPEIKHLHSTSNWDEEEWLPKVKPSKIEGNTAIKARRGRKSKILSDDFLFSSDTPKRQKIEESFKINEGSNSLQEDTIPNHSARTLRVNKKYYIRNVYGEGATANDFIHRATQADILRYQEMNSENMNDADTLKKYILDQRAMLIEEIIKLNKKHQRKRYLEKRDEENAVDNGNERVQVSSEKNKIQPVFKGEIIVKDFDWLKKITNKTWTTDSYARILPWNALLKGFTLQTINVYCVLEIPLRLMLGVGKKITTISRIMDIEKYYQEIFEAPLRGKDPVLMAQSENVRNLIKWLHAGSLSSKYKSNFLSFLLVESFPGHFEVRGLCTQDANKSKPYEEKNSLIPNDLKEVEDITEIKHKNLKNEISYLFLLKCQFKLRELVEDGLHDDHTDSLYMWVGLPEVYKVAKWRMIFLKEDFAYLFFNKIKYSISYLDLMKLTEIAKEAQKTLIIRNLAIRRSYNHNMYGIYVSPKYSDRVFIGPYFLNHFEEDISTLKYINRSLISFEAYNRMTGEGSTKCGHWMHERPDQQKPKRYLKETIDLTAEDEPEASGSVNNLASKRLKSTNETKVEILPAANPSCAMDNLSRSDGQVIYQYGQKVIIKSSKPRTPTEFNRFIITNIPHFGYLGAFQTKDTLEVSWPLEKKVLVFENADKARDFLQERFNQLLQPVPASFKIQVIVLVQIDLKENQPINSEHLNGHCICGFFGTYNINDLTDQFCRKNLNMTKEEIGQLFIKRAEAYIAKRIEELAEVSGMDPKDKVNYNVKNILERAREQIKLQEHKRINLSAQIHSKEAEVIANIKRVFVMIKDLPAHRRNIEARIVNDILKIRPHRLGSTETIVINDDDLSPSGSVSSTPVQPKNPRSLLRVFVPEREPRIDNKRKVSMEMELGPPLKKIIKINTSLGSGSSTIISPPSATITSHSYATITSLR